LEIQVRNPDPKEDRFNTSFNCFKTRTFARLLAYINAVEIKGDHWIGDLDLKKTDLFDRIFRVEF